MIKEKIKKAWRKAKSDLIALLYNCLEWWKQKREYFFYWLLRDVIKYPEASRLNFPLIYLRFLIMPLNTIWHLLNNRMSCYDVLSDIYTINGCKYTGDLFRAWGTGGMIVGEKFEIVKRNEGYFTVRKVA